MKIVNKTVTANDLCRFACNEDGNKVVVYNYNAPSGRAMLFYLRNHDHTRWLFHGPKRLMSTSDVKMVLDKANEFSQKPDLLSDLLHLFNGFSLYYNDQITAAFLYGWMFIEDNLNLIWEKYVDSLERSANEKIALKDHRSWTTYHHIEVMSSLGQMNTTVRDLFNKLRKRWNDVVHNRQSVEWKESFHCLQIGYDIIINLLNGQTPFNDIENNELVLYYSISSH